ncbi:MAG: transporter substrate-binding protein, partial [Rhodopila sp.]|nr:transporter substrate-binding protein [Rhodopila sp.]
RDTLGVALTNIVGGADPATELKRATSSFQPVLDKSNEA